MKGRLLPWVWLGLPLMLFAACKYVSFNRPATDDDILIKDEIRSYYDKIQSAFVTGNPDALASLFSPSITHPMTFPEVKNWSQKFFAANRNAHFRIDKLTIESWSYINASVLITYKVETPDGKGDFGGTERDALVKEHGQWYISGWEKTDPNEKKRIETLLHRP